MDQFSLGFQIALPGSSILDISYVGTRGRDIQTEREYNIPSLEFRKKCNIFEGGSPGYCDAKVPNPFYQKPAFAGTSMFSSSTISRFQSMRPFPQFDGNLTQQGLNEGATWYNSLQVNFNVRFTKNLNLLANYTLSKFVERWGYTDVYRNIRQQGPYFNDRPHAFKLATIYQLPFGKGRWLGSNANRFVDLVIGGWELSTFITVQSGEPSDLPGNVRILRDPKIKPNWHSTQVYGLRPCVLKMNDAGDIAPQKYSLDYGCGTDQSTYNFMILPNYAPRETPFRSGQIRMYRTITMDGSLNKTFGLTERFKLQTRIEAFNLLNHYALPLARFNTNPNDGNFGSLFPGRVSTVDSGFPRQMQLGLKLTW
jgi:hypothetical protein